MSSENSTPVEAPSAGNSKRRTALTALTTVVVLGGLGWAAYEWLVASHYEGTDDAYVQGNVVQITPQISGTVQAIMADDTDFVKAGQPLIQLDPADARIALDQAEANLAQTVRQVRGLYANNSALQAQVAVREADVAKAQSDLARAQAEVARANDDLKRRQSLVEGGAVSREELNHAETSLTNAKSMLATVQAGIVTAQAGVSPLLEVTDAQTALTQAESNQVNALYNYNNARSRIDKAVGRYAFVYNGGKQPTYLGFPAPPPAKLLGQKDARTR